MNTVLNRPGLLVSCTEPSHRSASNHLLSPPGFGLVLTRSLPRSPASAGCIPLGTLASFGLHHCQEAGHDNRPNRVRHPADQRFTSSCSPPPLARTQLLSVTTFRPNLARTCTLLIRYTYKRTSRHTPCAVRQPGRPEQCVPISGTPGNRLCPVGRRLVDSDILT